MLIAGWSCCSKRALSFDEFLNIKGCTVGEHDAKAREEKKPVVRKQALPDQVHGKSEVYGKPAAAPLPTAVPVQAEAKPVVIEQDEEAADVPSGAKCKRNGCDAVHVPGEDRMAKACLFHPGPPIFHEGWLTPHAADTGQV